MAASLDLGRRVGHRITDVNNKRGPTPLTIFRVFLLLHLSGRDVIGVVALALKLVMRDDGAFSGHSFGHRIRQVGSSLRSDIALDHACLAAAADHNQISGITHGCLRFRGRNEKQVDDLFENCFLGDVDESSVEHVSRIQRHEGVLSEARMAGKIGFQLLRLGLKRLRQAAGSHSLGQSARRGQIRRVITVDENEIAAVNVTENEIA